MAAQKQQRSSRRPTGGRPGERSASRVERLDFRFPVFVIAHLRDGVLRRPIEFTQYAAGDYQTLLADHKMECSMSGVGACWDNAVAESFFAKLKRELADRADWYTREEARTAVFEYIEVWYNQQRRHSSLGYLSPSDYEQQLVAKQQIKTAA